MSRVRAYLELGRVSNIGTVWSNVIVGCVIASPQDGGPWIAPVGLAMSLLYVGGMAMNDLVDLDHDRATRAFRPIASGRIGQTEALLICVITMILGSALMAFLSGPGLFMTLALVACIIGYNLLHKKTVLAAVLMGACRSLVIVTAGVTAGVGLDEPLLWGPAIIMGLYVTELTVGASREEREGPDPRRFAFWTLPVIPFLILLGGPPASPFWFLLIGGLFVAMLVSRLTRMHRPGEHPAAMVLLSLAMICIVDAIMLAWVASPLMTVSLTLGGLTMIAHRKILGT